METESLHSGLAQSNLVPSCQASRLYVPAAMVGLYLTLQQRGSGLFLSDATQACIRHDFFNVSKETALPSVKILSILCFLKVIKKKKTGLQIFLNAIGQGFLPDQVCQEIKVASQMRALDAQGGWHWILHTL